MARARISYQGRAASMTHAAQLSVPNDVALISFDLNLLVALYALVRERHVTRAAKRVALSQPAMSHALGRLRSILADRILVRGRRGMQLTPRAAALVEPLERTLAQLTGLLSSPTAFDPRTSSRRFRIAGSDYDEIVLVPTLLERIRAEAPNVDVSFVRRDGRVSDVLDDGAADVVFVPGTQAMLESKSVLSQKVLTEKFVCVVREDHPSVGKKLTLERFLELPHLLVSPREMPGGIVDDALAKIGRHRRVAVTVPHFLVAPFLVERTDLVLTLAARIAKALAPAVRLRVLAPPPELDLPGFDIRLVWHERDHDDPAHKWLRTLIASAGRAT